MRIAFYSPLKPPDHPVPSGDRQVARLFLRALRHAGHRVEIASCLRSYEGAGDAARQERIRRTGNLLAKRYVEKNRASPPELWFTYHLYHKAPDWIGPVVAEAFGIPYLVAEASHAPKQQGGAWAAGHRAVAEALRGAARIVCLNPDDAECIGRLLGRDSRIVHMKPFLETDASWQAGQARDRWRAELSAEQGIAPEIPWIAITAMMRPGDKLASYRLLGEALRLIEGRAWTLLVAGDGEARRDVERCLGFGDRVRFLGQMDRVGIDRLHGAADLGAWPAINEAYGMALLQAQAAGLPMVAGDRPGVRQIVRDGKTGLLVPEGNAVALAGAVEMLLDDFHMRRRMSTEALLVTKAEHGLEQAAATLDGVLRQSVKAPVKEPM